MAAEIIILTVSPVEGGENFNYLQFYVIAPVIYVGNTGQVLVPTPADSLPEIATEYNLVPAGYLAALDNGTAMFEQLNTKKRSNESDQQVINRLKDNYPARKSALIGQLRRLYSKTGTQVDL